MPSFSFSSLAIGPSPQGHILDGHVADQPARALRQPGSARGLGLPTPEEVESLAAPADQVSAFTFSSAPRQGKNWLNVAMSQRVESSARRGLALRS